MDSKKKSKNTKKCHYRDKNTSDVSSKRKQKGKKNCGKHYSSSGTKGGEEEVDPARGLMKGLKALGHVHCVSLPRTHMKKSADKPLNILISPFLFRFIETYKKELTEKKHGLGLNIFNKELSAAYVRLFEIFEETKYIPPLAITFHLTNEMIHSFTDIQIVPGFIYQEIFRDSIPKEILSRGKDAWINSEENFAQVMLTTPCTTPGKDEGEEGAEGEAEGESGLKLFCLLGSDKCVLHEANLVATLVNNALIYYSLISKLGCNWRNIYNTHVSLLPVAKHEGDPVNMNRVVRLVTMGISKETEYVKVEREEIEEKEGEKGKTTTSRVEAIIPEKLTYSIEEYNRVRKLIGWSYSKPDTSSKKTGA